MNTVLDHEPVDGNGAGQCPITFALEIFGDKWSLLVIRDLLFKKKRSYSQFLESPEGISTNILASRLAKLEQYGMITKAQDPEKASKSKYCLTGKGRGLLPVLLEIVCWSAAHDEQWEGMAHIIDGAPADLIGRFRDDRAQLLEEILADQEDCTT